MTPSGFTARDFPCIHPGEYTGKIPIAGKGGAFDL